MNNLPTIEDLSIMQIDDKDKKGALNVLLNQKGDHQMKLITKETLEKWNACTEGYKKFNELFPEGAYLQDASENFNELGLHDYTSWLWSKCKRDKDYVDQTSVTAGEHGTASAGDWGNASAGDHGNASAGYYGNASAGDHGTASAGGHGTASAGDYGAIVIQYYNGNNYAKKAGAIGENGLKPNTFYKVENGEFVEVEK